MDHCIDPPMKTWRIRFEFFGFLFMSACTMGTYQDRIVSALNATALSVEAGETSAEVLYEANQEAVLDYASRETPLPTQAEVQRRLGAVRRAWDPVWEEFDALRGLYAHVTSSLVVTGVDDKTTVAAANEFLDRQKKVADMLHKLRDDFRAMRSGPQEKQ